MRKPNTAPKKNTAPRRIAAITALAAMVGLAGFGIDVLGNKMSADKARQRETDRIAVAERLTPAMRSIAARILGYHQEHPKDLRVTESDGKQPGDHVLTAVVTNPTRLNATALRRITVVVGSKPNGAEDTNAVKYVSTSLSEQWGDTTQEREAKDTTLYIPGGELYDQTYDAPDGPWGSSLASGPRSDGFQDISPIRTDKRSGEPSDHSTADQRAKDIVAIATRDASAIIDDLHQWPQVR